MKRENLNLEQNQSNQEKKSIFDKFKKILPISAISAVLGAIVSAITILNYFNNVDLDIFIARDLMNSYEEAYSYALLIKGEKYDNENNEQKKSEIKDEAMKGFKEILSQELYNEVEGHIFAINNNEYHDLKDFEYQFEFTHNKKGELILSVNDEDDTIIIEKPYYYKINKDEKTISDPIHTNSRIYKVKRKSFASNQYILSERVNTSKRPQ